MQGHFSPLLRIVLRWLFGPIHYAPQHVARVRQLAKAGVVVYVTRGRSSWLAVGFNYLLLRAGLPLAAFVAGVRFWPWQTPTHLWRAWRRRRQSVGALWRHLHPPAGRREQLAIDTVLRGDAAFVALPIEGSERARRGDFHDYLRALLFAQRLTPRPLLLAPHALVDREQAGAARRTLVDRLFGDRRRPGGLRRIAMLLTLRRGSLRLADPIDLAAFIAEHPGADDLQLARLLRQQVHWRLDEEERVVAGPRLTFNETLSRRILADAGVRRAVAEANLGSGKSDLALEALALRHLDQIAAHYDVRYVKLMAQGLNLVFNRIYDGIAVDEASLGEVIEASRRGPLIFCPSHRSHIDYLVLSFVLWQHRITPPHIAAGANLAFFPLGTIFRRCGAFFLRRTYRDDPLYAAVLRAYVSELIRQGVAIEFFLEGTRSRSGKFLPPKFGVLSMLVDAWRGGAREDLSFVPISIDYERIIEAPAYARELEGGDKRAEDLTALLRTTRVLRSRYGRVHLQFGTPLSLSRLAAEAGLPQSLAPQSHAPWRRQITRLGYRILHNVAGVGSVTATGLVATVLLGHPGRGMAQGLLLRRGDEAVAFLADQSVRLSDAIAGPDTRVSAILEAVQKLVDEGRVVIDRAGRQDMEPIYRVPEGQRVGLDFHKNSLMNHFAPSALMARALVRHPGGELAVAKLQDDCRFLSQLFKKEFIFPVQGDFEAYFQHTLAKLRARSLVADDGDGKLRVLEASPLLRLARLLDGFVECYWVCARCLHDLRTMAMSDRELTAYVLERIRRAFLEGTITRAEAASRSLVDSALAWMREADMIVEVTPAADAAPPPGARARRPMWQLGPEVGPETLQAMIGRIEVFLLLPAAPPPR